MVDWHVEKSVWVTVDIGAYAMLSTVCLRPLLVVLGREGFSSAMKEETIEMSL